MFTDKILRHLFLFGLSFVCILFVGCQPAQQLPAGPDEMTDQAGEMAPDAGISQEMLIQEQRMQAVSLYVDAMMLNDLNEREKAIEKLNMAVNLDPEFALAFSMKGDLLQEMEEFEDSADAYEKATELDPWSFKDFYNLGKVCQVIKQFARAVAAYVAACNLDAEHYPAHIGAAQCFYELKEFDTSMTYANKAKELGPDRADPEKLIGDLFEEQKDHTQAINAYRRALELEGNQPTIMVSLARAYLRSGRYSAANELLTDAIKMEPDNGMAHQYLGFTLLKLKNTQSAIASYEQAVKIDDNDWMAHKGLGVAYMLLSMKNRNDETLQARAIEQWNISLQIKDDQPKLRKLLEHYTN